MNVVITAGETVVDVSADINDEIKQIEEQVVRIGKHKLHFTEEIETITCSHSECIMGSVERGGWYVPTIKEKREAEEKKKLKEEAHEAIRQLLNKELSTYGIWSYVPQEYSKLQCIAKYMESIDE